MHLPVRRKLTGSNHQFHFTAMPRDKTNQIKRCRALGLSPLTALAAGGHGHSHGPVEITKSQAEKIASYRVAELVLAREIHESWSSIVPASAEKTRISNDTEWVVVYDNDETPDADKKKLFVFLSSTGDYIAANFTGR
jgi:hypothetical protein